MKDVQVVSKVFRFCFLSDAAAAQAYVGGKKSSKLNAK